MDPVTDRGPRRLPPYTLRRFGAQRASWRSLQSIRMGVYSAFATASGGTITARPHPRVVGLAFRWDDVVRLARFVAAIEALLVVAALVLGSVHAVLTRGRLLDSFSLMVFVIFVLILFFAILSGPGAFLSRPRLSPLGTQSSARWRRWLSAPPARGDLEFFELVLYTGIGFLLLVIGTAIGAAMRALGG